MSAIDLTAVNPFTPILDQLWAILEADAKFTARVLSGSRIKFTVQNPRKTGALQPGECPEVVIEPGNDTQDWAVATSSMEVNQTFVITVLTNDMRPAYTDSDSGLLTGAFELEWIIARALMAAGDTLGISYVTRARVTTALKLDTSKENRGHEGWAALITVSVRLTVDRAGDMMRSSGETISAPTPWAPLVYDRGLLTAPEDFTNAAWVTQGAGITADATPDPAGAGLADAIVCTSTSPGQCFQEYALATELEYVFSVYLKAGLAANVTLLFDECNGILSILGGPGKVSGNVVSGLTSAWTRVQLVFTADVDGGPITPMILLGKGGASCYAWGAKLEVGQAATPYYA